MSAQKHILFEVSDEIATVTLNRPEARNALSEAMRVELGEALGEVRARAGKDVKAMILTGAGGAFCAGGDVKSMGERDRSPASGRTRLRNSHEVMYELMNVEVPVISLVDGAAAGAGANIALAADFVLATPRGFFLQAFGRIGLVPDWGGFFILPRIVGLQKAKELVFTARRVYAEEAKTLGMVYEVVPAEGAMERAREFAGRFRGASTTAIGIAKNILNQSYNLDHRTLLELEAFGQGVCGTTEYHAEAVRRFREKEPPLFDWDAMDRANKRDAAE
jgi:2-(1,2-epoxy-1,2-dihydrophenyl)acetyl-CoA isomerase